MEIEKISGKVRKKISYSYLQRMINFVHKIGKEGIEFGFMKKCKGYTQKIVLVFGTNEELTGAKKYMDKRYVPYLHFHPTTNSLPSREDIDTMIYFKELAMVISKNDISIYSPTEKNKRTKSHKKLRKRLRNESKHYNKVLHKLENILVINNKAARIKAKYFTIDYFPLDKVNLENHDFREIPKLDKEISYIINLENITKKCKKSQKI